jgi:hypothetical protein
MQSEAETRHSTQRKALALNRDEGRYGTFAEIGAGQEVARWFFQVGGASGTVAKTMSAYDMVFSDAIYGPAKQYVSRQRLLTMLDHEYDLLLERLDATRGERSHFFVYANTVKARGYQGRGDCHGWMGVRFQTEPRGAANEIIVHVWLNDPSNLSQQEALGIFGVNLIYAAMYHFSDPRLIITSLVDGLTPKRIEIDMLEFRGPAFEELDNYWVNLELVRRQYTSSAIFAPNREILQASELLYLHPLIVCRGSFRPVMSSVLEMLNHGKEKFAEMVEDQDECLEIMEISIKNLREGEVFDSDDYLARIDLLNQLGKTVMVSNRPQFHRLAAHLRRNTKKNIGLVLGAPLLKEIFEQRYYEDLDGGLLEACGRLFKRDLTLFVYPVIDPQTGILQTASSIEIPENLRHLLTYLLHTGSIRELEVADANLLGDKQSEIAAAIARGESGWESWVPEQVATTIKKKGYFGWPSRS